MVAIFGEILRSLRENKKISQDGMAEYLGVKRQTYGAYERGVSMPDLNSLIKIAQRFGVSTDYLLGLSEHKTAENEAMSKVIPLSDAAVDFIKSCPAELFPTLDGFLSDENTTEFLGELATHVYSLDSDVSSEVAAILARRIVKEGSSTAKGAIPRILGDDEALKLATRLTPAVQQTRLFNALISVALSMKERADGSASTGQEGGENA